MNAYFFTTDIPLVIDNETMGCYTPSAACKSGFSEVIYIDDTHIVICGGHLYETHGHKNGQRT